MPTSYFEHGTRSVRAALRSRFPESACSHAVGLLPPAPCSFGSAGPDAYNSRHRKGCVLYICRYHKYHTTLLPTPHYDHNYWIEKIMNFISSKECISAIWSWWMVNFHHGNAEESGIQCHFWTISAQFADHTLPYTYTSDRHTRHKHHTHMAWSVSFTLLQSEVVKRSPNKLWCFLLWYYGVAHTSTSSFSQQLWSSQLGHSNPE